METQKCENFSKSSKLTKLNSVCTPSFRMSEKRNHLSFVNISPTLAIDTSMERSSRVVATPWKFKKKKLKKKIKKVRNSNFDEELKSP